MKNQPQLMINVGNKFELFPNVQPDHLNYQRDDLPEDGADIYRMELATKQIERLTFQTIDRNGMVLNMAQTWHQVRPGEA